MRTSSKLELDRMFDTAKIFSRSATAAVQIPFERLCESELNLFFKKRSFPTAFTEAKISMALFRRWQDLKNGIDTDASEKENADPN